MTRWASIAVVVSGQSCPWGGGAPAEQGAGFICGMYAENNCCSDATLKSMQQETETEMMMMDDLFKAMPAEYGGPSPTCNKYLQDRAGCLFCNPDAAKYVSVDGSTIAICGSWWESFQEGCKDMQEAYKEKEGVFSSAFWTGSGMPSVLTEKPTTLWGYNIRWTDDGCIHQRHEGTPVWYFILGGAGLVIFAIVLMCCLMTDCCGCCSGRSKGRGFKYGRAGMGMPAMMGGMQRPGMGMRPPMGQGPPRPPMPGGPMRPPMPGQFGGPPPQHPPYQGQVRPGYAGGAPMGVQQTHTVQTVTTHSVAPVGMQQVGMTPMGPPLGKVDSGYGVSAPPPPPGMGGAPNAGPGPIAYQVQAPAGAYQSAPAPIGGHVASMAPVGYNSAPTPGGYQGGKYGGID